MMTDLSNKFSLIRWGFIFTLSQMALFPAHIQAAETTQAVDSSFSDAQNILASKLNQKPIVTPAKNVILFIGDGMGISTVTATRILDGQLKGGLGEENILSWETFPYTALS